MIKEDRIMKGLSQKTIRIAALLMAMLLLFGVPGSMRFAKADGDGAGYYLVGSMNGWTVNAAYKLAENPNAAGEYMITLDLAADAEFKIVYSENGTSPTTWYPDGENNNGTVDEAGNYTIYFRSTWNSEWGNFFYVAKNEVQVPVAHSVTATTDGNGTATVDPGSAFAGDTVTVTIKANKSFLFDAITGAPSDWAYNAETGVGTFTMPDSDVTLSVTFKRIYSVSVLKTGTGTVAVNGTATAGSEITLTVTPGEGYQLRVLKVDGMDVTSQSVVETGTYVFVMPAYGVTVEAVFEAVEAGRHFVYVFTDGLGTAFADKTAAAGDSVTVTAENSIGFVFDHLEMNGTALAAGVTSFTMPDGDAYVTAVFRMQKYEVRLISDVQGSMNAIPRDGHAYADATVQIIVNADENYAIESLTVKNDTTNETVATTLKTQDGQTSIYEFTMPASNVTVTAAYHKRATDGYYLIGTHGWASDPANNINMIDGNDKFVDDLSVSGQMMLTVNLTEGQSFKVVKVVNGAIDAWYPTSGGNYIVDSAHAGSCVIYFRPAYGGASDWFQNCIYVKKLENEFYLVSIKDSGNTIRQDDKLYINKEFNANAIINSNNETIHGLYGSEYEHMVLTWLNTGDRIKVVRVVNGSIVEWLPDEPGTEYPIYRYHDGEYTQDPAYTGMVFVFFEEQIGKVAGKKYPRIDWTNHVFDVQKAYKADAAEKASVNPLNAESLTYNLAHGSITLSTGTPFIREGRSDASAIPTDTSNIVYELGLGQKVYCTILAEAGYTLDGTPYVTYNGSTVNMTQDGDRWYFTMPSADIVIHAPMRKVFRSQSVLLSGQLGVNFYVDLSGLDRENCCMQFKAGNKTSRDDFDPTHTSSSYAGHFGFTCFVNAIQMADPITAELWCGNDRISSKTYSIQEYATYFDRTDSTVANNNKALRVIRAMLDFGYYSQQYLFRIKPSIESKYAPVTRHYTNAYDYEAIKAKTATHSLRNPENKNIANSDVESVTLQLSLESATTLIVNLNMKEGTTSVPQLKIGSVTLNVGDDEVAYSRWKLSLEDKSTETTRSYQLRIKGISPHNLDMQFTIKGTANGSFTIKASAFSYVDSMLNADSIPYSDYAKLLAASMYEFHAAEVAYRQTLGNN